MKPSSRKETLRSLALIWKCLSDRRRKQLLILQIVCLIAALSEVVNLGALLPVLRLLANPTKTSAVLYSVFPFIRGLEASSVIIFSTFALLLTVGATTLLRILCIRLQLRLSAVITSDISDRILESVLTKPYSWHTKTNISVILGHLFHDVDSVFASIQACLVIATNLGIVVLLVIALLLLSPVMLIATVCLLGTFYAVIFQFSRGSINLDGQQESHYYQKSLQIVQESLGGIRDIILDNTKYYFLDAFHNYNKQRRLSGAAINIKAQVPRFLIEGFTIILVVSLALILSMSGKSVEETLPLLGTFSLGLYRLLQPLQQCFGSLSTISAHKRKLLRLSPFVRARVRSDNGSISKLTNQEVKESIEPIVSLRNISFSYSAQAPVLSNISLSVRNGERIAFVGKTGSGKSTLSDIILGLIRPGSGSVVINGHAVLDQPHIIEDWHRRVAHVPQQIYLCDAGIASNIAFGVPEHLIDMKRVCRVAKQACIADLIESWPNGYATIVGERGIRLSGGQIQRIGIARALYKNAKLLVLDEATSALDVKTESEVMESIIDLDRSITIVLIAHRLSTIQHCDRIVYLSDGIIKATGTFSDLEKNSKSFQDFIRMKDAAGRSLLKQDS